MSTSPSPSDDLRDWPVNDVVSGYDHPGYRNDDTAPFDVAALLYLLSDD